MTVIDHNGNSGVYASQWHTEVPRSIRGHTIFGLVLLMITFGSFSAWAFYAPLAAAVIAQGSFVATGQNKIVQHLEGGIIKEILVTEGQRVEAGDPLLTLDETTAQANQRALSLRSAMLEAIGARLYSEYHELDEISLPEDLLALRDDPEISNILLSQERNFEASRYKLLSDITLLQSNMDSLDARRTGYRDQLTSVEDQLAFVTSELADKMTLYEQGYMRKSTINALERSIADAEGQIGRLKAEISQSTIQRTRYEQEIRQTKAAYRQTAIDELQTIKAEHDSVREQIRSAENILTRSTIVAPVSGVIVRSYYHTSGGVIESGKPIFEITPADVPLIIEAQVTRNDIDSIAMGQSAMVRLVALNQRTTPILEGAVQYISA
ncbi:MAG: HlyD family type I secretion periplasmic adaptor subunit, partial [Pseudomonadota bacterium]